MNHNELKDKILRVDENFTEGQVNNLLKQLPEQEVINALKEFKDQFEELAMAEQFLCAVSLFVKYPHPAC